MLPALRRPTRTDILKLVFIGAMWGGSFIFIAVALQDYGPISIAAWRVFLAAIVLVLFSVAFGQAFPRGLATWRLVFVVGLLNSAVPFFLISWGQQFISSAESALLMATGTFCALLLSHFFSHDERINFSRGLGVATGFAGVVVLVFWDLQESGLGGLKGQLAVMAAGCSYATSSVIARRITHLPPISTAASTMLSACIYLIPLAFILENPLPANPENSSLIALFYLGVLATALGFVIRFTVIRNNGAVFMAQVGYLVPLFGVIWSWLYFSDAINLATWLSLILIIIGIAITRRGS
jgi:drug/metabolite transporter (DMT)-like permease